MFAVAPSWEDRLRNRSSWKSVRQQDSQRLHALAFKLRRDFWGPGRTQGQERLWHQIIAELEYRSCRPRRWCEMCKCELCRIEFEVEVEWDEWVLRKSGVGTIP